MSDAQTINLDCAPGSIRPGDLIAGVLKGTGIEVREPIVKFFGNWTWDYSDIDPDLWERTRNIRAKRITDLYNRGLIRYGDW